MHARERGREREERESVCEREMKRGRERGERESVCERERESEREERECVRETTEREGERVREGE